MQATAARLIREGRTGCVINIASNSGFVPKLEQADYGASKAALVSLTRSAALSLGLGGTVPRPEWHPRQCHRPRHH